MPTPSITSEGVGNAKTNRSTCRPSQKGLRKKFLVNKTSTSKEGKRVLLRRKSEHKEPVDMETLLIQLLSSQNIPWSSVSNTPFIHYMMDECFVVDIANLNEEWLGMVMRLLTELPRVRMIRIVDSHSMNVIRSRKHTFRKKGENFTRKRAKGMPSAYQIQKKLLASIPRAIINNKRYLQHFELVGIQLTSFEQIIDALKFCEHLERLYFDQCNLGDIGLDFLATCLTQVTVSNLQISACELTSEAAHALYRLLQAQSTRRDNIQWQENLRLAYTVSGKMAKYGLRSIDVSENQLGDLGIAAMCRSLAGDPYMQCIDVRNNSFGHPGLRALIKLLRENSRLLKVLVVDDVPPQEADDQMDNVSTTTADGQLICDLASQGGMALEMVDPHIDLRKARLARRWRKWQLHLAKGTWKGVQSRYGPLLPELYLAVEDTRLMSTIMSLRGSTKAHEAHERRGAAARRVKAAASATSQSRVQKKTHWKRQFELTNIPLVEGGTHPDYEIDHWSPFRCYLDPVAHKELLRQRRDDPSVPKGFWERAKQAWMTHSEAREEAARRKKDTAKVQSKSTDGQQRKSSGQDCGPPSSAPIDFSDSQNSSIDASSVAVALDRKRRKERLTNLADSLQAKIGFMKSDLDKEKDLSVSISGHGSQIFPGAESISRSQASWQASFSRMQDETTDSRDGDDVELHYPPDICTGRMSVPKSSHSTSSPSPSSSKFLKQGSRYPSGTTMNSDSNEKNTQKKKNNKTKNVTGTPEGRSRAARAHQVHAMINQLQSELSALEQEDKLRRRQDRKLGKPDLSPPHRPHSMCECAFRKYGDRCGYGHKYCKRHRHHRHLKGRKPSEFVSDDDVDDDDGNDDDDDDECFDTQPPQESQGTGLQMGPLDVSVIAHKEEIGGHDDTLTEASRLAHSICCSAAANALHRLHLDENHENTNIIPTIMSGRKTKPDPSVHRPFARGPAQVIASALVDAMLEEDCTNSIKSAQTQDNQRTKNERKLSKEKHRGKSIRRAKQQRKKGGKNLIYHYDPLQNPSSQWIDPRIGRAVRIKSTKSSSPQSASATKSSNTKRKPKSNTMAKSSKQTRSLNNRKRNKKKSRAEQINHNASTNPMVLSPEEMMLLLEENKRLHKELEEVSQHAKNVIETMQLGSSLLSSNPYPTSALTYRQSFDPSFHSNAYTTPGPVQSSPYNNSQATIANYINKFNDATICSGAIEPVGASSHFEMSAVGSVPNFHTTQQWRKARQSHHDESAGSKARQVSDCLVSSQIRLPDSYEKARRAAEAALAGSM